MISIVIYLSTSTQKGAAMPIRYTLAPPNYDGFGTNSIAILGVCQGRELRQVEILPEHLEWQENRYWSGNYRPFAEFPEHLKLDK
jgi:hypothetical protein